MRRFWRATLPAIGLALFTLISVHSFERHQDFKLERSFYWSSLQLDSEPLVAEPHPRDNTPVITPGLLARVLMIAAFPAFLGGAIIVGGLGRFGVNQVWTFMLCMPVLIAAWFYFVGWMLDRLSHRLWLRTRRTA